MVDKSRQLGVGWLGNYSNIKAATGANDPTIWGFPCLWKVSLLRGAQFPVRPLAHRQGERKKLRRPYDTATRGASKAIDIGGAGGDGSCKRSADLYPLAEKSERQPPTLTVYTTYPCP